MQFLIAVLRNLQFDRVFWAAEQELEPGEVPIRL